MKNHYVFALRDNYSRKYGNVVLGQCLSKHRGYLAAHKKKDSCNKDGITDLAEVIEDEGTYEPGSVYSDMINQFLTDRHNERCVSYLNLVIDHELSGEPLPEYVTDYLAETGLSLNEIREKYGELAQALRNERTQQHQRIAEMKSRNAAITAGVKTPSEICYSFPAVQGIQAGKVLYSAMIPIKHLLRIFTFDEEDVVPAEMRAQRQLNVVRAKRIGEYILNNLDDNIFSGLTATVSEEMSFKPFEGDGATGHLGILNLPMDSVFNIIDGQHRRAGYEYALKHCDSRDARRRLSKETVCIVIKFDQGLNRSQQYISDINCSLVKSSSSISALYNHRDPFNRLIQDLLQTLPGIKSLVDMENASVGVKSLKLWSLVGFSKFVSLLTGLNSKNTNDRVTDENRDQWFELIQQFIAGLDHLPSWKAMIDRQISGFEARQELIISHTVFLEALGQMGRQLIQGYWGFPPLKRHNPL